MATRHLAFGNIAFGLMTSKAHHGELQQVPSCFRLESYIKKLQNYSNLPEIMTAGEVSTINNMFWKGKHGMYKLVYLTMLQQYNLKQ